MLIAFALILNGCIMDMLARGVISHGIYDPDKDPNADEVLENPVAMDKASLDRGAMLFKTHCVECHGPKGIGDGPKSKETTPAVANLTKVKDLSDTRLYKQISMGKQDMPTWQDKLSTNNIWDLVNYIKKMNKKKA
jgi:mono/diheme cytochrome c family protein